MIQRWFLLLSTILYMGTVTANEIAIITAPVARDYIESGQLLAIHVLSEIEYDIQHIPKSINIPVDLIETSPKMPQDRNSEVLFYCMGVKCPYSELAAQKAQKMGYQKIYWFRGGIEEWYQYNYPMNTNEKIMQIKIKKLRPGRVQSELLDDNTVVVDVRPKWWDGFDAYITNSLHLPLIEMKENYQKLPKKRIIIADAYMRQSISAARFLRSQGYDVIGVLKGGVARWIEEKLPTVTHSSITDLGFE